MSGDGFFPSFGLSLLLKEFRSVRTKDLPDGHP